MKSAAAFLALLMAACLLSAADPAIISKFTAYAFEPDQGVQAAKLLAEGDYYLISAGGNETYVVDASNGSTVLDSARLSDLLEQDARNRGGFDAMLSSAEAFAGAVNDAKAKDEALCVQYIGDDEGHPCTGRESCLVSCFSVPQCEIIVQSDGFLESMMDWNFKRKDFAAGLSAFSSGIEAIRFDTRAIDSKTAVLANLSALAANMSQNGIFLNKEEAGCSGPNATRRCYEYCPKIDYSPQLISSQSQNLAALKATLAKVFQQQPRAELILNKSAENDAYLASRGRDYEDFRMRMKNDIRNLKLEAGVLASTVNDTQVAAMVSQLENISSRAANLSGSGFYRQALALRPSFESQSNATGARIGSDEAKFTALSSGMSDFASKVKSSAWLIGNASAATHLQDLSALQANYTTPLTLPEISAASGELSLLAQALDAEIASKAVQAGNSSSPPGPSSAPIAVPDFVWAAAILLAAGVIYTFALRFARRAPPSPPPAPQ